MGILWIPLNTRWARPCMSTTYACFGFSPHSAFAAILSRSCGRPSSSTSSQHNHIHRAPHLPPPRAPALLRWARVSPDLRGTPPWSSGKTLARLRQLPSYPAATHRCRHRPCTYLAHTYLAQSPEPGPSAANLTAPTSTTLARPAWGPWPSL